MEARIGMYEYKKNERFGVERGVEQSDPSTSWIFNVVLEKVFRKLEGGP